MTIKLPDELESRLRDAAAQRGMTPDELAGRILEDHLGAAPQPQTLAELFAEWEAEDRTDDPEELARRQREFEEFKAAINRNRIESEGPDARRIFP